MSEFFNILLNVRSLRAVCRELTHEQLVEAREKFELVYHEIEQREREKKAREEKRQEDIKEYIRLMESSGIDIKDLIPVKGATMPRTKRKGVDDDSSAIAPKYRYMDGLLEKFWCGRGRMPKAIAVALENGKKLEDFKIQ